MPARHVAALAAIQSLILAAAAGAQTQYSIKKVGPPSGDDGSFAGSINSAAEATGWSSGTGGDHAFYYDNGSAAILPDFGAADISYGIGINAAGEVVGRSATGSFPSYGERAALWSRGDGTTWAVTNLGLVSGHYYSSASAINGTGLIVGGSGDGFNYDYAVVWELDNAQDPPVWVLRQLPRITNSFYTWAQDVNDSSQVVGRSDGAALLWTRDDDGTWNYTQLGGLSGGDGWSDARGINAGGVIVGQAGASDSYRHAVRWSNSGITDLGPANTETKANAINASGVIVGTTGSDALRWTSGGTMSDLQGLIPLGTGWDLQEATDINDSGQILGTGVLGGYSHTFLLTPVALGLTGPTPGTAGAANTFAVSGAGGGGRTLWYSFSGGETAITGCGDTPLNLGSPTALVNAAPGVTSATVTIPGTWSGLTVYFQVSKGSGRAVSNVVRYTFP